jgi:creatinine amidohydrolase
MEMSRELRQKGVFVSVFQWWDSVNEVLPSLFEEEEKGHAAAEETSVNLALHPNIVDMGKAVDVVDMSKAVDEYARSGVSGRSTSASAEKGRKVFEAVVNRLVEYVKLVQASKIEDLLEKSKV